MKVQETARGFGSMLASSDASPGKVGGSRWWCHRQWRHQAVLKRKTIAAVRPLNNLAQDLRLQFHYHALTQLSINLMHCTANLKKNWITMQLRLHYLQCSYVCVAADSSCQSVPEYSGNSRDYLLIRWKRVLDWYIIIENNPLRTF